MGDEPQDAAIVSAAATLGVELGLRVVAEGVETAEAWRGVRYAGCEVIQGYLVSRPIPASEFAAWRARWESRAHRAPALV